MTVMPLAEVALPAEVAALRHLESSTVERLRHEALTVPRDWVTEYGDYQTADGTRCR